MYECTGNPHPRDIEAIVSSMMNDEFQTSFKRSPFLSFALSTRPLTAARPTCTGITDIKTENGLALQDIILGIFDFLQTVELPSASKIYILDHLAQVECVFTPLARF